MNSMIIEQLKKANVIDSTGKVTLANLATYTLTHDILVVMYDGTVNNITGTYLRAVIEKWTFQDKVMGEQFITFDFLSEQPVAWAVNDYCIFRGERFVLNYIPSVTQKGRRNAVLDSYKYEGVKLNSLADELTRCQMLDVVLTSGQHDPDAGTNYTGSSQFQLFCGETTVNGVTRTAVMTLGDRILANLNRMYGENVWSIVYGDNTHTEDQQLSFDNQYVSEALAEVKNKFDLNYAVKGRTIYIGCELGDVAGVDYGFGPGYPTDEAGGKGLFELKKISDSSQQIVTRLRVLGSTKNLPYRYYNNAYPLPQALFPLNLQLPDTFLPEGSPSDPAGANTKWGHNKQRSSQLRAVKGATNDSYIDKNDDAAGTTEGIREATIRFDGSDSKLEEIYPTIENVTYDELRGSNVPDQDGNTGPGAYPNYESDEKVNEILAIGYKYDGQMFDDANIGSGILSEDNGGQAGSIRDISISQRVDGIRTRVLDYFCGTEQTLFTVAGQTAGRYFFTPVMSREPYFFYSPASVKDRIGFIIRVKATSGGITTTIAEYKSDFYSGRNSLALPSIPDVFYMMDAQVREIALSGTADITVTFIPCAKASTDILYGVGPKPNSSYTAQYVWNSVDNMDSSGMPFHFFVKDMGFDFAAQFNGETPTIVMKSGDCVGREFQIGQSIEKVEYQGKKGYMLTLNRASDSSLNTYYPNARNQISADDQFVITGIDMPDAYIKAAEMRLLSAATEWLAENGNTNFHYQPAIDDIYLKRNYENMVKAGTPQDSVFWKIYAGYDLTFHPIPDNPSDPEPEAISVAIESVTITMGEGLTRKVDILLNDELKESTLKRVSREVKDLSNKIQQTGSGMSTATMETAIRTIGDKQYLSKVENDTAAGDITFNGNIRFNKDALFAQGAYFGENLDGSFNTEIDPLGNIQTARNVEAMWGVAAYGMASLAINGGGGQGTVTAINFEGSPEQIYTPSDGLITLPDYPTAASLISDGLASQDYVASYFASNFTKPNIKSTLGISDWALEPAKPSYNFSEIGSKPTTLAGYNITDAHITNGVVTLGQNTITPATLNNGKIPLSQIPDAILGQMLYGGTVNGSGVVTLSQNAKDKWGITSLTLTSTNYADYEGAFFIASANGSSGVPSSLGVLVGDWIIATSAGWGKIDNTDAVTGVKGSAESNYRIGNVNITPANIGLGNVENTALSTWTGSIKIVTLGTINTGVWHGSAIADDYIASASAWNAKYDKPSGGIPKTDLASAVQTSLGKADTALQSESDPVFTASAAHGITSGDITAWNNKQNALAFDGTYDASTNKVATKSTVTNAINALDVSNISGFGAGKTLASLTETDGKIAATFQNISITKSQVSDFPTTWALSNITGADDLKAIEALTGTSGFLKKTAANTWSLDTDVASGTALSGVSTRVGTLEGYFTSGVANNAAKLGGQLPSYYAVAADYTKTTDFQSFSIKAGSTTLGTYSPTSALIISLVAGSNISFTPDATNHKLTINNTYSYTLPMASADSRGGIRVGNTLNIDSNGILNANIYDGLDQGYTTYALSAKQGKALNTALGTLKTGLTSKGAHNLPIYLNSSAEAVAIDALSVSGNVESTAGGVSAMGIASLALNGGGGQGTLTQIQVNGVALADTSGVVNITATTGNANGKIAIAGQQIPVYGLGSLAYLSSLAFTDLSSHPTTLGGYGITDAKIANGVITLGGNTISPLTSINADMINTALGFTLSGTSGQTYSLATISSNASNGNTAYGYFSNGVLPASKGGTGKTSLADAGSAIINALGEGSSNAQRDDYIVAQYAGGGTTTTTYYRRKLSKIFAALNSGDITTALGYTPYNSTNPNGYISGITSSMVTTALGYTPFNNANFTKANIKSTLEISDWALAASKPSYAFSEITGTASDSQIPTLAISKISGLQTALDGKLATSLKGAANGLAELDANGLVPSSQLPSYVDDVLEYASKSAFPATGTSGKIYVALDTNLTYRWSGSAYTEISPSLALGETSSTAYRGDRGKTAYDHATDASRLTTAKSSGFYKFATTAEGHIASVTAVAASDLTGLLGTTYVTGISWDSTNNKLAWSKGGTAQTAFTIGYATNANYAESAYSTPRLFSAKNADGLENAVFNANTFQYGVVTSDVAGSELRTSGVDAYGQASYINIPWTNANFGGQIFVGANSDNQNDLGFRTRHGGTWGVIRIISHSGNSSVSKSGETLTVKINGTEQSLTNTNTHRPIQLNGTEILGNNTTALNLKAGTGVSLTNSSGTVTFDNSGVRAATINGNYLRINTNGTNADLTIPYASRSTDTKTELLTGQEFIYRQTAGGGLTYKPSAAVLKRILGKTLVWNQLLENGDFSNGTTGWTFYQATGSVSDKIATITIGSQTTSSQMYRNMNGVVGHKYYQAVSLKASTTGKVINRAGNQYFDVDVNSSYFVRSSTIVTCATAGSNNLEATVQNKNLATGATISVKDFVRFDLTLMFGQGKEPSLEDFEKLYLPKYYSYNAGQLINNSAKGLETVGFNIFESNSTGSSQYIGDYYINNAASNYSRTANSDNNCFRIPVFANTTYYLSIKEDGNLSMKGVLRFVDSSFNLISGTQDGFAVHGFTFTTPSGCKYIEVSCDKADTKHIVLNVSDVSKNGQYEPYKRVVTNLSLKEINVKSHNIWDEVSQRGYWNASTGQHVDDNNWVCSVNPISVKPNTIYRNTKDANNFVAVFYDKNMNWVGYVDAGRNVTFTTPANAYYMHFYGSAGMTYCCINESSSFNGQYEPHGVLTFNGLNRATNYNGSLVSCDEIIDGKKYIKRYGIKYGTQFTLHNTSSYNYKTYKIILEDGSATDAQSQKQINNFGIVYNGPLNSGTINYETIQYNGTGSYYYISLNPDRNIQDFVLIYELATPIEYELAEPLTLEYPIDVLGTEGIVSDELVAPFVADIQYGAEQRDIAVDINNLHISAGLLSNRASALESYFTDGIAKNAARLSNTSAIGSATKPVYFTANGVPSACSDYAGGTAVTLNGTSKAASTASFYAPTGAGTSGQILKSTAGTPEWINQSAITAGKATILETTCTIWGRDFNGSANVTGDMSNVGNIAFQASGKNIGGTMYFDTTNHRVGVNDSTPSCAFDVTGDIQASGGVAAGGILNLAYNGAGTQGTLTQIQINGRALTDSSGIVNIPLANTTSTGDGAMSHSDKLKLDGIATGATNVTTDTVAGWGYVKDATGIANALGYIAARENKKSRLVTGTEYRFQSGDNDCINIWIVSAASVNLYLPYDWDYQTPLRLIIANAYSGTVTVNYKATSGTQKIYSQSDTISLSAGRAALVEMIQFYNASVGGELTFVTSSSYLQRSIT